MKAKITADYGGLLRLTVGGVHRAGGPTPGPPFRRCAAPQPPDAAPRTPGREPERRRGPCGAESAHLLPRTRTNACALLSHSSDVGRRRGERRPGCNAGGLFRALPPAGPAAGVGSCEGKSFLPCIRMTGERRERRWSVRRDGCAGCAPTVGASGGGDRWTQGAQGAQLGQGSCWQRRSGPANEGELHHTKGERARREGSSCAKVATSDNRLSFEVRRASPGPPSPPPRPPRTRPAKGYPRR